MSLILGERNYDNIRVQSYCQQVYNNPERQGENMKGKSMVEGAPWKHILRFALPVLAGSLLQQLYNTVDTIVVGNFSGEDALSAVGTTGSITFLFLALAIP